MVQQKRRYRKNKNKTALCTACYKTDAELLHPFLRVPICGSCKTSIVDADKEVTDHDEAYCIWCGFGDGCELYMCDTCIHSYCTDCVERNFGKEESIRVRGLMHWSYYLCEDSDLLKKLQGSDDSVYNSLSKLYATITPPSDKDFTEVSNQLILQLTPSEMIFGSLFFDGILDSCMYQLGIVSSYLVAGDLFGVIYCLSKGLRNFFKSKVFVIPGLFKTSFGEDNGCCLHRHQEVSLNYMIEIENRAQKFGALRGGIFGDEPGLGKTVTTIALIAATAGTLPLQPQKTWDSERVNSAWKNCGSSQILMMLPVLNKLRKANINSYRNRDSLKDQESQIRNYKDLESLELAVREAIKDMAANDERAHIILKEVFRKEMAQVKELLDPSQRKYLKSSTGKRLSFERSLHLSAATLIIVPKALLEHWYEQIKRHLALEYFTTDIDSRGVVYLDGLGDIVDFQSPISRLTFHDYLESHTILAQYLIVVTTFERCASMRNCEHPVLSKIRWLRLIVDEGHVLGLELVKKNKTHQRLCTFIKNLAAERRWVMSGTPTTGSNSEEGLKQLFNLLQFLRHPDYIDEGSEEVWKMQVIQRCLSQNQNAWSKLYELLQSIMVRHTKDHLQLFDPIKSTVNIDPLPSEDDPNEDKAIWVDRAKARYISGYMLNQRKQWEKVSMMKKRMSFIARSSGSFGSPSLARSPSDASATLILNQSNSDQEMCLSNYHIGSLSIIKNDRSPSKKGTAERREMVHQQAITHANALAKMYEGDAGLREPKAIVFSQHEADLQGVGHFLYLSMGESAICEHWGVYRSSELSRFRNGCRKFKLCPMCGHKNGITNEYFCEKTLLVVEYLDNLHNELDETNRIFLGPNAGRTGYFNTSNDNPEPAPGGHGYYGAGGHYVGPCLCSPIGCDPYNLLDPNVCQVSRRINKTPESPVDFSARPKGHPNPFYSTDGFHRFTNPSMAIVAEEHIRGYTAGRRWYAGQEVFVTSAPPSLNGMRSSPDDTFQEPLLWRCGRLGGRAVVRFWNTCGGHNNRTGWHGNKVLCSLPWQVERQEASVLLLQEDGSTGLDLSFATHLFLLERVKDPALLNQIISRAHRMGAKGPVHVQLIQVRADEEEL